MNFLIKKTNISLSVSFFSFLKEMVFLWFNLFIEFSLYSSWSSCNGAAGLLGLPSWTSLGQKGNFDRLEHQEREGTVWMDEGREVKLGLACRKFGAKQETP